MLTEEQKEMFKQADKFIELANELAAGNEESIGLIGAALRYAAARYNAFEVSLKTDDIARDKDEALGWFTNEYHKMMLSNLNQHIEKQAKDKSEQ